MSRSRTLLGAFWIFAGTMHFIRRREYEAIVPDYAPISAADAVTWSGYAEIAGGVAVLPAADPAPRSLVAARRAGRWSSPPTSTWRSTRPRSPPRASRRTGSRASLLWARLPVQALFARWAWRATE